MPASTAHARPSASGQRRGFTLIELIVVLLLMGLAFALAAPSFTRPTREQRAPVQRVLDAARSAAVRRGQTMQLDVRADGRWTVTAGDDSLPLLAGVVDGAATRALRLTISPLGVCMADLASGASADAAPWDPLRCTLVESAAREAAR